MLHRLRNLNVFSPAPLGNQNILIAAEKIVAISKDPIEIDEKLLSSAPSEGKPRDVAGKVMDMLFPDGAPSRIPIAAITGTNGKTTTARMLSHILKTAGHIVGNTATEGVYIDGHLTVGAQCG